MRILASVMVLLLCCFLETPAAKERAWQTGEIEQVYGGFDSGTRSPRADMSRSRSQGPTGVPTVRQFIDIRAGRKIYTIQRTIVASSLRLIPGKGRTPEDFEEGAIVEVRHRRQKSDRAQSVTARSGSSESGKKACSSSCLQV